MLKQDMRKYIINGRTFEEFVEDLGEEYINDFTMEIMEKCWVNTHKLVPRDEWLRYLKKTAAQDVKYLGMLADALNEEGIVLNGTRAGGMLAELISKQREFALSKEYEDDLRRLGYSV